MSNRIQMQLNNYYFLSFRAKSQSIHLFWHHPDCVGMDTNCTNFELENKIFSRAWINSNAAPSARHLKETLNPERSRRAYAEDRMC